MNDNGTRGPPPGLTLTVCPTFVAWPALVVWLGLVVPPLVAMPPPLAAADRWGLPPTIGRKLRPRPAAPAAFVVRHPGLSSPLLVARHPARCCCRLRCPSAGSVPTGRLLRESPLPPFHGLSLSSPPATACCLFRLRSRSPARCLVGCHLGLPPLSADGHPQPLPPPPPLGRRQPPGCPAVVCRLRLSAARPPPHDRLCRPAHHLVGCRPRLPLPAGRQPPGGLPPADYPSRQQRGRAGHPLRQQPHPAGRDHGLQAGVGL